MSNYETQYNQLWQGYDPEGMSPEDLLRKLMAQREEIRATIQKLEKVNGELVEYESSITQNAENIELKVSETDFTGATIASKINLSSTEVTIESTKIKLSGTVTLSSWMYPGTTTIDGGMIETETILTDKLAAGTIDAGKLTIYAKTTDGATTQIDGNGIMVMGKNTFTAINQYGINPDFIKRHKNTIYNSSFELSNDAGRPLYWSGGVVASDSNFDDTYSVVLTPGEVTEQYDDDNVENNYFIRPMDWGNYNPRFSFYYKFGQPKIYLYATSGGVDTLLTSYTFNAADNTVWLRGDFTTDITGYESYGLKIKIENVGTTNLYVDAVQLEPDFTGMWPSFYTDGPRSIAGLASGSSNGETMEYAKSVYDSAGVIFNFSKAYTNLHSVNMEIITTDDTLLDGTDYTLVSVPQKDTSGNFTGVKVIPKGSAIPVNNTALELSANCIVS